MAVLSSLVHSHKYTSIWKQIAEIRHYKLPYLDYSENILFSFATTSVDVTRVSDSTRVTIFSDSSRIIVNDLCQGYFYKISKHLFDQHCLHKKK